MKMGQQEEGKMIEGRGFGRSFASKTENMPIPLTLHQKPTGIAGICGGEGDFKKRGDLHLMFFDNRYLVRKAHAFPLKFRQSFEECQNHN